MACAQSWCGGEIVIGTERHDQEVRVVARRVGRYPPRVRIDRGYRLLREAHTRLEEATIRQAHRFERSASEHHVELGVAEDERVAVVDQRDRDVLRELLREQSG